MNWDNVGWLANVFLIIGIWNTGNKKRWAFLFVFAGECIWALASWKIGTWSMVFICIVFATLAIRNWCKWGDASHTQPEA